MATGAIIGISAVGLAYNIYSSERAAKQKSGVSGSAAGPSGFQEAKNYEAWKKQKERALKWAKYYKDIYEDPSKHPEYSKLKGQIERTGTATRGKLADTLRRLGIVGGQQKKVLKDVAAGTEKNLADVLMSIKKGAREQQISAEQSIGTPFQGISGTSSGYSVSPPAAPGGIDLRGLGAAYAYTNRTNTKDFTAADLEAQQLPYEYGGR